MDGLNEIADYVEFDEQDKARLRALWPLVEPNVESVVDKFYERVRASPRALAVLEDDAQILRLANSLKIWLKELLNGPWDAEYAERRRRIGHRHVEIGLDASFMYTAMAVVQDELMKLASGADVLETYRAVNRVTTIDLALMTGTFLTAHERKELAALQELIVSHMPVSVYLLDAQGCVVAATRPGISLFGGAANGSHYSSVIPTSLIETAGLPMYLDHYEGPSPVIIPRVDVEIGDAMRAFHLQLVYLDHATASVLIHVEELTGAIEAEARLRRAETLAQLGTMSAAVAHELRNPLAGISGAIQVISRSFPSDDRRRNVMIEINAQIHRLNHLVSDLLSFARPESAQIGLVELRPLVEQVCKLLRSEHPGVHCGCDAVGDGVVHADPRLLQNVLLNLAQNAVQAAGPEARVTISLSSGDLCIRDNGPGVPQHLLDQVFRPFFTTRTRGTGLGLAICRKLCEAMQARIEHVDEPGSGACFRIRFQRL
jgi:signal transduction histidine kinase